MMTVNAVVAESQSESPVLPDSEIRKILTERIDGRRQSVGIVVGVVEPQGRRVIAHGHLDHGDPRPLNGETVFEIGSVTKVFTALLLADMAQRGEVALIDPVAKYLPKELSVPERNGRSITLEDLATHTSGLPRMPSNFAPKDPNNPYADYSVEQLYQFLSHYELTRDIGVQFEYSNLGGGLLGHALSRRIGVDYETLVQTRVAGPLGMSSTGITLSPELQNRLAVGHSATSEAGRSWDLPALAGAGARRSTAHDLQTFVEAALGFTESPLARAFQAMLNVRRPSSVPYSEIALGWMIDKDGADVVWHGGGTGGYRSFVGFVPKKRVGVVALSNTATSVSVHDIGRHL
ncbi:MAG: beta-lactamase family protein, partial [Methylocystis sp.]|nr:beta-lactamase family protein [Methylocystis sp.]